MYNYNALSCQIFRILNFYLRPISITSMETIRQWRNAQMSVLRQKHDITSEMQTKYFHEVIKPNFTEIHPKQILFEYYDSDTLIGYGGLVHISWEDMRAEVSFLLDPILTINQTEYQDLFSIFLKMLKQVAFVDLRLNKIFTETYDIRPYHVEVLERSGFVLEGTLRNHVLIDGAYKDSLFHGALRVNYE